MNTAKIKWVRFTWKLADGGFDCPLPKGKYEVRQAERSERAMVEQVVWSSFDMDSAWARYGRHIAEAIQTALDDSFAPKNPEGLVLVHGARIIGVSLLNPMPDQPSNMTTGPCVLIEYRSRGMGTLLLAKSLENLADRGLDRAAAITPAESIAARYVYPKFGGTPEPYNFPLLSAKNETPLP